MELVAKGKNVSNHISNNVKVTEIKLDTLCNNLSVLYEDFYKFINKRLEIIYLFARIYFWTIWQKNN
jgi:hypothetical protein